MGTPRVCHLSVDEIGQLREEFRQLGPLQARGRKRGITALAMRYGVSHKAVVAMCADITPAMSGRRPWTEIDQGGDLTPDEVELGRAMLREQFRLGRRNLTYRDQLAVVHALGYRRDLPPAAPLG